MVTFTLLRYPPGRRYRAFADMGRWLMRPFRAEGLRFQKLMGSGQEFGLWPDWGTYVFLSVWESEAQARRFFDSADWQRYVTGTSETGTLWLQPFRSHGSWDGINPFAADRSVTAEPGAPVAVLTRATIRSGALWDFWRHVPQTRKKLLAYADRLLFSIGVGEKPIVQQCTVSVWRDARDIEQFAYRASGHREVVQRTRQRRWYSEELFARFNVVGTDGVFSAWEARLEVRATETHSG